MDDSMKAFRGVVELLTPLESEQRARVLRAVIAFFGEASSAVEQATDEPSGDLNNLPPRARLWMKQNSVTAEQLQQVFHISENGVEVIAPHLPGKSKKEQTYSAYILTGIAQLLATGNASFEDKSARDLCERSGCYDSANHSVHLRNRGNEFTGTKEKGWTLTTPGLRGGADLVKELSSQNHH